MAKDFRELQKRMTPEQRARVEAKVSQYKAQMALDELREAREMTQERLAEILGIGQGAVSRMEQRTDVYVSTLRSYIAAMGGRLKVEAVFPEGTVEITNFHEV